MSRRFDQWASLGAAVTYAGRNLIVKNSVLAMAWYMVESQTFEGEDAVFTRWQASAWRFVEASVAALRSHAAGPTAHAVARTVLAQDYPQGGRRCLDVELFARSLRVRAVRALAEPSPHPYKNLVFHWVRTSYPHLWQDPRMLIMSNCDFAHLLPEVPPFWRQVLQSWGSLGGGLRAAGVRVALSPDDYSPPLTYQASRPLPPFDDGIFHPSPTPRIASLLQHFSLGAGLSLPIG